MNHKKPWKGGHELIAIAQDMGRILGDCEQS